MLLRGSPESLDTFWTLHRQGEAVIQEANEEGNDFALRLCDRLEQLRILHVALNKPATAADLHANFIQSPW